MSEDKKIIIDEDKKSKVKAEQEAAQQGDAVETGSGSAEAKLAEAKPPVEDSAEIKPVETKPTEAGALSDDPEMPPASISMLMSSLATEALISMGQFPHPATGEIIRRKNQAKYLINTLEMLREKTAGNVTDEEETALRDVLHQLRMAFVQLV